MKPLNENVEWGLKVLFWLIVSACITYAVLEYTK